jgi:glycosyltransferase involved in cell wall biosynthesis
MTEQTVDVVIAVPTRGTVRAEWAAMLTSLAMPINTTHQLRIIPGRSVEEARNVAVVAAREVNARYLFFLDDDVLVPNQALRRMIYKMENEPEWDLLTGIVPVKTDPPEPCVFRGHRPGAFWGWTFNEFFEIDACGMAACLIRMEAFDKVEEPWFKWERDHDGSDIHEEGEDIGFCNRLREAGGRLLADGGLLCGHMNDEGRVFSIDIDTAPFRRNPDALKQFKILEQERTKAQEEAVAA